MQTERQLRTVSSMGDFATRSGGGFSRRGRHRKLSEQTGIATDAGRHVPSQTGSAQDLPAPRAARERSGESIATT